MFIGDQVGNLNHNEQLKEQEVVKYLFFKHKHDMLWFTLHVMTIYRRHAIQSAQGSKHGAIKIEIYYYDNSIYKCLKCILQDSRDVMCKYNINYQLSKWILLIELKSELNINVTYYLHTADTLTQQRSSVNIDKLNRIQLFPGLYITRIRFQLLQKIIKLLSYKISREEFMQILFYLLNYKYIYLKTDYIISDIKKFTKNNNKYDNFRLFMLNTYYVIEQKDKITILNQFFDTTTQHQQQYVNFLVRQRKNCRLFQLFNHYRSFICQLKYYPKNTSNIVQQKPIYEQWCVQMQNWLIINQIRGFDMKKFNTIIFIFKNNILLTAVQRLVSIKDNTQLNLIEILQQFTTNIQQSFSTKLLMQSLFDLIDEPKVTSDILEHVFLTCDANDVVELTTLVQLIPDNFNKVPFILFLNRDNQKRIIINDLFCEQNVLKHDSQIIQNCDITDITLWEQLLLILIEYVSIMFRNKFQRPYAKLIDYINQKNNILTLATADDYSLVMQSYEFQGMITYIQQFFIHNLLSYEYMMLQKQHQSDNNTVVPVQPYDVQLAPSFSITQQNTTKIVYNLIMLKNKFARNIFISLLAQYVVFILNIDKKDKLLKEIEHIRTEHRNLIEENNALLNDYVKRNKITFKLSIVFTKQIIFFIENDNYPIFLQQIARYCNSAQDVKSFLIDMHKHIENFSNVMPRTYKLINYIYSNQCVKLESSVELILRSKIIGLLYEKDQLDSNYFKFIVFMLDLEILAKNQCPKILTKEQFLKVKDYKQSTSVIDNINNSIKCKIYTQNDITYYYIILIMLKQQQHNDLLIILKALGLDLFVSTQKLQVPNIVHAIAKSKQQLITLIDTPQTISCYKIKERLINMINHPIVDLFQVNNYILDIIVSTIMALARLDELSMFFQIALDYQLLREFQAAGVEQQIGYMYHYDCNLKDEGLGGNEAQIGAELMDSQINKTIRRLSVPQYRFFIIFYCALSFISSTVYGQYRGPKNACAIISDYKTLKMDRINYLITQISNSFKVLQNYKGLTEAGTLGIYQIFLEEFIVKMCNKIKIEPLELENQIIQLNVDQKLQQCINLLVNQSRSAQKENERNRVNIISQNVKCSTNQQCQTQQTHGLQNNKLPLQIKEHKITDIKNMLFSQLNSIKQYISLKSYNIQQKILNTRIFYQNTTPKTQTQQIHIYRRSIPEILLPQQRFDQFIHKYAQNYPERADFIRIYYNSLPHIFQLFAQALLLHNYIIKQYNGKLYWYELQTQQMHSSQFYRFINAYSAIRQKLPDLGNGCASTTFPEVTQDICLEQLILTEYQENDTEQTFSIINQVYRVYNHICQTLKVEIQNKCTTLLFNVQQLVNELLSIAQNYKTLINLLLSGQLNYDTSLLIIDYIFKYLTSQMKKYSISEILPSLKVKFIQTYPLSSYYQFIQQYGQGICSLLNINLTNSKFQKIYQQNDEFWRELNNFSKEIIYMNNTAYPMDVTNMVLLGKLDYMRFTNLKQILNTIYGYEEEEIPESLYYVPTSDVIIYASILLYKQQHNFNAENNQ